MHSFFNNLQYSILGFPCIIIGNIGRQWFVNYEDAFSVWKNFYRLKVVDQLYGAHGRLQSFADFNSVSKVRQP